MAGTPCFAGVLRLLALIFALVTTWIFLHSYSSLNMKTIRLPRWLGEWGSLLGQGLWTRMGPRIVLPPSVGDPGDSQIWQSLGCLWDSTLCGGGACQEGWSPWRNREVFQDPGQNMCLHQGPFWKCDSRKNGQREEEKKEGREEGREEAKRHKTALSGI